MKIRNMREFRTWFKKDVKQLDLPNRNEHFVGCEYEDSRSNKTFGFYELYHGHKPNIANDLMDGLKNAQDGQAIYEFIQNAADCESNYFAIFYNDDYFLAINNGKSFSQKDINSILNANQSSKTDKLGQAVDCSKIGRFGIGFKLVHRLVGENDGMKELTKDYKGPIIFSWSEAKHIQELKDLQADNNFEYDTFEEESNAPYLFKILITNFPSAPSELIRDIDYKERVLFPKSELNEFLSYFKSISTQLDFNLLDKGSMFFIKLGKNKRKHLDGQYESLMNGVKCGLNNLNDLKYVFIRDKAIEKLPLNLIEFSFNENEIINPEDPFCPVKTTFGYLSDYKEGKEELKASPNFYKFFPMSRETHGLNFILHSTAFRIKTDRTQFEEDSSSTNTSIFNAFWTAFEIKLQEIKNETPDEFRNIYANLLISKPLLDDNGKEKWFYKSFYQPLLSFLKENIPTKNNQFSDKADNVKIKDLKINLNLSDFGLEHIQWFEWESDNDYDLTLQATDSNKLGLESWDIRDIIENANLESINEWIASCDNETYKAFLDELENSGLRQKTKEKIYQIKLFPFTDGTFQAFNEILYNPKIYKFSNEIEKLGFGMPKFDISNFKNICSSTNIKPDKEIFLILAEECKTNTLTEEEKKKLFLSLIDFDNVGKTSLKELYLFCDSNSHIRPLKELIGNIKIPTWLNSYKIKQDEYFPELNAYLISEKELYQDIILPNWNDIVAKVTDIPEFYQKVKFYYDQDDKNTPLEKQAFIFVNKDKGFVTASEIFYNHKFLQISNYKDFQSAVFGLNETQTPEKQILSYLKEAPFKVDSSNLLGFGINDNTELSLEDIKTVLEFCKSTNERFFESCIIEKKDKSYCISSKTSGVFQAFPSQVAIRFIQNNFLSKFKVLPSQLADYKDENGILYREPFYNQLIDSVDIDFYQTELVDIIAYDDPKRKFLLELSEICFDVSKTYNEESFEYKILNLACDSKIIKEVDYQKFRGKITIQTDEKSLKLDEIPPFADKVKIEGVEISLAKILPKTYQHSEYLGSFLKSFEALGNKLKTVLGIEEQDDYSVYYELLLKELPKVSNNDKCYIINNIEQLVFLVFYVKLDNKVDLNLFHVRTFDKYVYALNKLYYFKQFSFLHPKTMIRSDIFYKEWKEYSDVLTSTTTNNLIFLEEPYFSDTAFFCDGLIEELSEEQRKDFIDFLFRKWKNGNKRVIRKINWTTINGFDIVKLLGFNPKQCVYPSKYALENEKLPLYIQKWIDTDEKTMFLSDLGVFTEHSILVSLRKFLWKGGRNFNKNMIATEHRFITDETILFNTFKWLKSRQYELKTKSKFETFDEVVRIINNNRNSKAKLKKTILYDFEILENEAKEWTESYYQNWKKELNNKFSIYLFEGILPRIIKLNEIEDYIFYRCSQGNIVIDSENNIYINQNVDIKNTLSSLTSVNNNFTTDDLLRLYQSKEIIQQKNDKVVELESEVQRLRKRIAELEGGSGTATYSATVSSDDNYHDEIKEKSETYLFGILKKLHPLQVVKWLNYNEVTATFKESWEHHDFEIQDENGNVLHYIDCKGTPQNKKTFYLTSNEWRFFLNCVKNKESYQIYRVFNMEGNTNFVYIDNLWEWIKTGKVVPYLSATETIKGGRVFLTLL